MPDGVGSGYKRTDVGVLPVDWKVTSLAEITDPLRPISYGIVQTGPNLFDGVPCLRVLDINDGLINKRDLIKTSQQISAAYKRTVLKPGDLVMPLRGKVGDVGLVDADLDGANLTRGVALIAVRQEWSGEFCQQMISWPGTRRRLEQSMNGSALQEIPIAALRLFRIPLPATKLEQRAIAEALSDVDALLGALDRLIAKKRDFKQAAMQRLLTGQTRLPGFHGPWEVRTLREVCQKIQDGTHFSPKLGGNDFLYVTSKNIRPGKLDVSTAERISAEEHAKIYGRCDVRKDDVLLTKDGASTGNAALNWLSEPFSLLSSVALLRFDQRYHWPAYFLYQILSARGQQLIADLMSGNAITRLTLAKIRKLAFPVASLGEQIAIAEVLTGLDSDLAVLEQRREKTRAVKQGMMQELLTGRIRLV